MEYAGSSHFLSCTVSIDLCVTVASAVGAELRPSVVVTFSHGSFANNG